MEEGPGCGTGRGLPPGSVRGATHWWAGNQRPSGRAVGSSIKIQSMKNTGMGGIATRRDHSFSVQFQGKRLWTERYNEHQNNTKFEEAQIVFSGRGEFVL